MKIYTSETVSADYYGDGKADYTLRKGNTWIMHYSTTNQTQTRYLARGR